MQKVLSGYFDDAHRGLQRSKSTPKVGPGPSVMLPPLRPNSNPPLAPLLGSGAGHGEYSTEERDPLGWDKVMSTSLRASKSQGSLEFLAEHAVQGVQTDQYQTTLQENSKLARKVRALQDQLTVTSAKKEAFKAQAQRLEREFKKGRDQTDSLQKDLIEARREAAQLTKEAEDAIGMMTEMRKAHLSEVKLLQRGLQARGSQEGMRNRVNEMADLVDKVGKAVVQRDEAIRDKVTMESRLTKALKDLRTLTEDNARLKKSNKKLGDDLKELKRRGQYSPPKTLVQIGDDSDYEFEAELCMFEQRFEILEEGPAGLDVLASNLSKDKQDLEKKSASQQATIKSLNNTIENWKRLGAEKDQQIKDLSYKLEKMMRDQASLQEQIAQKQREIALQVEEERNSLNARIQELELECDNARAAADGMEKASTRLTRELVKVHEQFAGAAPPPEAAAQGAGKQEKQATAAPADTAPAPAVTVSAPAEEGTQPVEVSAPAPEAPTAGEGEGKPEEALAATGTEGGEKAEAAAAAAATPAPEDATAVVAEAGPEAGEQVGTTPAEGDAAQNAEGTEPPLPPPEDAAF